MTITHGSLFTGAGGFDLGLHRAGIATRWQAEIDKRCIEVLARNWPTVKRYGDVRNIEGGSLDPVDVVSFGSPCQDLSRAGRRKGMKNGSGTRSSLFFEAVRVIRELREETNGEYPQIIVWENVQGALTSRGGKDFKAAVEALAALGAMDISYRVANALRYGPPQRRVRLLVVADTRGERAGPILSEPSRVLWHPSTIGETGEDAAGGFPEGTRGDSEPGGVEVLYTLDGYNQTLRPTETFPALRSHRDSGDCVYVKTRRAQTSDGVEAWSNGLPAPTLNTFENLSPGRATILNVEHHRVRRITPREAERLMGWPDDYTRYGDGGVELADTPRFRMIGNGVSAPMAQWLGESIVKHY